VIYFRLLGYNRVNTKHQFLLTRFIDGVLFSFSLSGSIEWDIILADILAGVARVLSFGHRVDTAVSKYDQSIFIMKLN